MVNQVDEQNDVVSDGVNVEKSRDVIVTDMVDDINSCTRLGDPDVMPIKVSNNAIFQVDGDTTMAAFSGLEQETRWQFEVFALEQCE